MAYGRVDGRQLVNESKPAFEIRPMTDRTALEEMLRLRWSDGTIFVRGRLLGPPDVEAFGAYLNDRLQGIVTWRVEEGTLYLLTMNNITDRRGVSTALVRAVMAMGREKGFKFMRALLTNDNWPGFRFYQKRGFRLVGVHTGVVDMMRQIKPSIPEKGVDGIPMRDELELEIVL
jgi:ribosomal protein S18 acetylase RimI-like enzyme